MNDINHITKADYNLFQHDIMDPKEKAKFLEHICSCNYCADQFAAMMSEEVIAAPRDFKANVLKATRRPDVQIAVKANETSKRMQLFIYSLKVGTATICALLLLLLTMNTPNVTSPLHMSSTTAETVTEEEDNESLAALIRDGMDSFSNSVLNFSNSIMKTEVTDHDQKEK